MMTTKKVTKKVTKKRIRITDREWDAIESALSFVLAGENPFGDEGEIFSYCQSAYDKIDEIRSPSEK